MTTKDTAPYRPLKVLELKEAGLTLEEIGRFFGVSKQLAAQLVKEGSEINSGSAASQSRPEQPH